MMKAASRRQIKLGSMIVASCLVTSLSIGSGIPSVAANLNSDLTNPELSHELARTVDLDPTFPSVETKLPAPVKPLVIGGSNVNISTAPWQVALLNVGLDENGSLPANQFQAQFCGGSIVDSEWILTAAHCVLSDDGAGGLEMIDENELRILVGSSTLSTTTLGLSSLKAVSEIIVHPDYRGIDHSDIALIKLSKPLVFVSGKIQRIAISDSKPTASTRLTVSGWGAVRNEAGQPPTYTATLQGASQQALSDASCVTAFEEGYFAELSLCVGDLFQNTTSSACYGDSGGPVTQTLSGQRQLVGVVSYGSGSGCAKGDPWVATNAAAFLEWAQTVVTRISVSNPVYEAAGYQDVNSQISLKTLVPVSVELGVYQLCNLEGDPVGDECMSFDEVVAIETSELNSCALLAGGSVWCWGYNSDGQLGNGTTETALAPVKVAGISTATSIELSHNEFACALLSGGGVQCWGNDARPDGYGGSEDSLLPSTVSGISTATAIATGGQHSCALLSGGSVQCWGNNLSGQLGNGTTTSSLTPVTVSGISNATAITAGYYHSCAMLEGGSIKCWGDNWYGVLGNGTTTDSSTPVTVSGISTAVSVNAGESHTCAVLASGGVRCWGQNNGRLGNGTTTSSSTPVTVSGISTAVSVSAGHYSCAVLASGGVRCWGSNSDGALGDGTTTNSLTPVTVSGISSAVSVGTGGHSCVTISDGDPKCWGGNGFGQLGNGGTTRSLIPVTVSGLPDTTSNRYREISVLDSTSSTLQGSGFSTPEISTSFGSDFSEELPGVYELKATNLATGEVIASSDFVISDGEAQSFSLETDSTEYFPYRDGYKDAIVVSASALGQFGESVPMLGARVGFHLTESAVESKNCAPASPSYRPASCSISLDPRVFSTDAKVSLTFSDLRDSPVVGTMALNGISLSKTAVTAVSASRTNSTVYPSKDGYKDSSRITVDIQSSLGGETKLSLTRGSKVTVTNGSRVVKSWTITSSGTKSFTWDGKDRGRVVPGKYRIVVQANGPEGSKTASANISVSAKKLVSVKKTTKYKGSSLLRYFESSSYYACVRNTTTGAAEIWTLFADVACFGNISLPSDAKHEYGTISVTASFQVTSNQSRKCFYDTFAYILLRETSNPSKIICFNGNFNVSGRVDKSYRRIEVGVYAARFEEFNVKSVTVTFSYKTLK